MVGGKTFTASWAPVSQTSAPSAESGEDAGATADGAEDPQTGETLSGELDAEYNAELGVEVGDADDAAGTA